MRQWARVRPWGPNTASRFGRVSFPWVLRDPGHAVSSKTVTPAWPQLQRPRAPGVGRFVASRGDPPRTDYQRRASRSWGAAGRSLRAGRTRGGAAFISDASPSFSDRRRRRGAAGLRHRQRSPERPACREQGRLPSRHDTPCVFRVREPGVGVGLDAARGRSLSRTSARRALFGRSPGGPVPIVWSSMQARRSRAPFTRSRNFRICAGQFGNAADTSASSTRWLVGDLHRPGVEVRASRWTPVVIVCPTQRAPPARAGLRRTRLVPCGRRCLLAARTRPRGGRQIRWRGAQNGECTGRPGADFQVRPA